MTGSNVSFNPPPAVRPGESASAAADGDRPLCFNPPPAVRPGERARVGDRGSQSIEFQSAPGGEAGGKCLALTCL